MRASQFINQPDGARRQLVSHSHQRIRIRLADRGRSSEARGYLGGDLERPPLRTVITGHLTQLQNHVERQRVTLGSGRLNISLAATARGKPGQWNLGVSFTWTHPATL